MVQLSGGDLLARVNFPVYVARMITNRHLLVAGGGGSAKTGIRNAVEIYELSFNGLRSVAKPMARYDTGEGAIMTAAAWYNGKYYCLAAGVDGDCQLYQIQFKITDPDTEGEVIVDSQPRSLSSESNLRKRRQSDVSSFAGSQANLLSDKNRNSLQTILSFQFQPLQRWQTDFCTTEEPFQKLTRVSTDGKLLITAGADGHIRVWKHPDWKQALDIEAHTKEVDDLDIHPAGKAVVSVSRDGNGYIWDLGTGKKLFRLEWVAPNRQQYRIRSCRFGIVEGDRAKSALFTAHVPTKAPPANRRLQKLYPCFLVKWESAKYVVQRIRAGGFDHISTMTVSDDGRFVAIGTMSGNVQIYIAFSLQLTVHVPSAHNIFVTSLEFLPNGEDVMRVVGYKDASVISVSVDNQIRIHHVPRKTTIHVKWVLLFMVVLLVVTFTLASYLGV